MAKNIGGVTIYIWRDTDFERSEGRYYGIENLNGTDGCLLHEKRLGMRYHVPMILQKMAGMKVEKVYHESWVQTIGNSLPIKNECQMHNIGSVFEQGNR